MGTGSQLVCRLPATLAALTIFRRSISLSRRDPEIRLVFVATLLLNGAAMVGWLYSKQLVNLGFPNDPIL